MQDMECHRLLRALYARLLWRHKTPRHRRPIAGTRAIDGRLSARIEAEYAPARRRGEFRFLYDGRLVFILSLLFERF